jgi:hypothetical protein
MSAADLWASMSQGLNVATITARQREYFISLAKAEKIFDVNATAVCFPDGRRVQLRECKTKFAAYGGGIGTRGTGKFRAEVFFLIEFPLTKLQGLYAEHDLKFFEREGHKYKILKPTK